MGLDERHRTALRSLGYDPLWLDSGILSVELLESQFDSFQSPDAHGQVAYRFVAFSTFLAGAERISDEEIETILHLGAIDPNPDMPPGMTRHMFANGLICATYLTDSQFERVAAEVAAGPYQRSVGRRRLLRAVEAAPHDTAAIERCIEEGDQIVQFALLNRDDLRRNHVVNLAKHGATPAVQGYATLLLERLEDAGH